jgi:hypothetical protein
MTTAEVSRDNRITNRDKYEDIRVTEEYAHPGYDADTHHFDQKILKLARSSNAPLMTLQIEEFSSLSVNNN